MESNSVRNHTNDWQNRTTAKGESDLLITSIITDRIRRHEVLLYLSKKKKIVNSTKYETTTRAHYALCLIIQAWLGNRPFNCPIMKSNYKHDAYTDLSVLKSGWWEPVTFKNFVILLINSGNRTAWSPIRSVISNHSYNYKIIYKQIHVEQISPVATMPFVKNSAILEMP